VSNPSLSALRSYLSTQLTTLVGTGNGKLMEVKTGHAVSFAGYPACRFFLKGTSTSALEDQRNVKRTYTLSMELIYRLSNDDKAVAEQQLEDAMDAVMNLLEPDYTLGGLCSNSTLTGSEVREVDAPWGASLVLPMHLSVLTLQFF
jgi:hypothetical protein